MQTGQCNHSGRAAETALVTLYLVAIIIANAVVTRWGQVALIFTGFLLIPFDLVVRDVLHQHWHGRIARNMGALIIAGSVITYTMNHAAARVAIASAAAFASAAVIDTLVFVWVNGSREKRMHTSNTVSAVVDSLMFPLIAFGGITIMLTLSQAALKIIGGIIWTRLYSHVTRCKHRFDLDDIVTRNADNVVSWKCWKCGKEFTGLCGLDILKHGEVETRERKP